MEDDEAFRRGLNDGIPSLSRGIAKFAPVESVGYRCYDPRTISEVTPPAVVVAFGNSANGFRVIYLPLRACFHSVSASWDLALSANVLGSKFFRTSLSASLKRASPIFA